MSIDRSAGMGTERFANIACELIARACDVDKLRYRNSVCAACRLKFALVVVDNSQSTQHRTKQLRVTRNFCQLAGDRHFFFGLVEVKRCVAGGIDGDQNIGAFHAANYIRVDHHSGRGVQHSEKRPQ